MRKKAEYEPSLPSAPLTKSANRVRAFSLGGNENRDDRRLAPFPLLPSLTLPRDCGSADCSRVHRLPVTHAMFLSLPLLQPHFSRRIFLDCGEKKDARDCLRFVPSPRSHRGGVDHVDHAIPSLKWHPYNFCRRTVPSGRGVCKIIEISQSRCRRCRNFSSIIFIVADKINARDF